MRLTYTELITIIIRTNRKIEKKLIYANKDKPIFMFFERNLVLDKHI